MYKVENSTADNPFSTSDYLEWEHAHVNEQGEVTYEEAKKSIIKNFIACSTEKTQATSTTDIGGWKISAAYRINSGYLFSLSPTEMSGNDYVLGGFYKVDKVTGEISCYSPVMDLDEFKNKQEIVDEQ